MSDGTQATLVFGIPIVVLVVLIFAAATGRISLGERLPENQPAITAQAACSAHGGVSQFTAAGRRADTFTVVCEDGATAFFYRGDRTATATNPTKGDE
jgi:hypothetical protein